MTDGIESAIEQAKALAGDKFVVVNGGTIASQCLDARLLDEIWVDLVPVLLGGGTSFFDELKNAPVELEGPISISRTRRHPPALSRPLPLTGRRQRAKLRLHPRSEIANLAGLEQQAHDGPVERSKQLPTRE